METTIIIISGLLDIIIGIMLFNFVHLYREAMLNKGVIILTLSASYSTIIGFLKLKIGINGVGEYALQLVMGIMLINTLLTALCLWVFLKFLKSKK